MSWIRRFFGLDGFDLLIHVGVTAAIISMAVLSEAPDEIMPALVGASLLVLAVRRRFALRRGGSVGITTGEMAAERIAELEQRIDQLEAAQAEVHELAERLDFAERLLAQGGREPERIERGAP